MSFESARKRDKAFKDKQVAASIYVYICNLVSQ